MSYAQIKNVDLKEAFTTLILFVGFFASFVIAFYVSNGVTSQLYVNTLACAHVITLGFFACSFHKGELMKADKHVMVAMLVSSMLFLTLLVSTNTLVAPAIDSVLNIVTVIYFWELLTNPKRCCGIVKDAIVGVFK